MNRRCIFLDSLFAFNFNMGEGEYITDEQGKRVPTDTRKLGSTLMTTMLKEVEDFCDPAIKDNWSLKPHQQVTAQETEMGIMTNIVKVILLVLLISFFPLFALFPFLICISFPPILFFPYLSLPFLSPLLPST